VDIDIIREMIEINKNDFRRINHTLKVYALTKMIAEVEINDKKTRDIAVIASILHDIGIIASEKKYQSCAGKYQQIEGPPIAKEILEKHTYDSEIIDRVCYLISKHHTYNEIKGIDYQILIEADFIVNLEEDKSTLEVIKTTKEKIFKTKSGIDILNKMFLGNSKK